MTTPAYDPNYPQPTGALSLAGSNGAVDWTNSATWPSAVKQQLAKTTDDTPPQYLQDIMTQGGYDWGSGNYRWDATSNNLIDKNTGRQTYFGGISDPALGNYVVTNFNDYQQKGLTADNSQHFQNTPSFFFPGQTGETLFSDDPSQIAAWKDDMRTRQQQGWAKVAAIVGGGAALGGLLGSGGAAGGAGGAGGLTGVTVPSTGGLIAPIAGTGGGAGVSGAALGMAPAVSGVGVGTGVGAAAGIGGAIKNLVTGGGTNNSMGGILDFLPTIVNGSLALIGNNQTQDSIDNAVNASNQSTQAQIDYARETRDLLLKQGQPWMDAANSALPKLLQMAGISSGTSSGGLGAGSVGSPTSEAGLRENATTGTYDITTDPSYAFRRDESMRALEGSAAARGGLMSGGFAKSALDLAGNMASTEYSNIFNRVATIAGYAPMALGNSTSAINNAANTTTSAIGNQGNTLASAYIGSGNANANTLNQLATIFGSNWKNFTQGNTTTGNG